MLDLNVICWMFVINWLNCIKNTPKYCIHILTHSFHWTVSSCDDHFCSIIFQYKVHVNLLQAYKLFLILVFTVYSMPINTMALFLKL